MEEKPPVLTIDGRTQRSLWKKEQKVTLKMRLWMKEYIKTGNAAQAAKKIYKCSEANSRQIGYENVKKMDYQEFLEIAGLTDALIAQKLVEGMNATKIYSSHTEPDREVIDYGIRHKYLETTAKLKKRLTERDITIVSDKTLILDATLEQPQAIEGQVVSTEETKPS